MENNFKLKVITLLGLAILIFPSSALVLTGSGDDVVAFDADGTDLRTFSMEYTGESNFAVILLDSQGNYTALLANEIGSYNGTTSAQLTTGKYLLDIDASGPWSIDILPSVIEITPPITGTPITLSGSGDDVVAFDADGTDLRTFSLEYTGESNFGVILLDSQGNYTTLLANEIGSYNGTTSAQLTTGKYFLDIDASGPWSIDTIPSVTEITPPITGTPITLSGSGDDVVAFDADGTDLRTFSLEYTGESNFGVILLDSQGNYTALLANEIGSYNGTTSAQLTTGKYFLDIDASGPWSIDIIPSVTEITPPITGTPITLSGSGDDVVAFDADGTDLRTFSLEYTGESNFGVILLDSQGNYTALLANEIGSYNGTTSAQLTTGKYFLDIDASGPWSIDILPSVTIPITNNTTIAYEVNCTTYENTPIEIILNAFDSDGDLLTYTITANPSNGTLGIISGNQVLYTPYVNYTGIDRFLYHASDGDVVSNDANVTIEIKPIDAPVANFTANETTGILPLTVQFTDISTNEPTSWAWDFGDSANSTLQNPVHTYTNYGTYNVSLTVTNAAGEDTIVKNDYIQVIPMVGGDKGYYLIHCNVEGAKVYFDEDYKGDIINGTLLVKIYLTATPYHRYSVSKAGYVTVNEALPTYPAKDETKDIFVTLVDVTDGSWTRPPYPEVTRIQPGYPDSNWTRPPYPEVTRIQPGYPDSNWTRPPYPEVTRIQPGYPDSNWTRPAYLDWIWNRSSFHNFFKEMFDLQ